MQPFVPRLTFAGQIPRGREESNEGTEGLQRPFIPNVKYEDFSKQVLTKLLKAYCREMLVLDAYWQGQVRKRLGDEVVRECLHANWTRIAKHEMGWTMEAANIEGNDVSGGF